MLAVGQKVLVFSSYRSTWVDGFEVAEVLPASQYRLRRLSDLSVLPDVTGEADLRAV